MSMMRAYVSGHTARLAETLCGYSARLVGALRGGDSGQDMVEYALTAAIVVLGLLLALFGFQIVVELVLNQVCEGIDTAAGLVDDSCINLS